MTFSNLLRMPGEIRFGKKKRAPGRWRPVETEGFTDYLAETSEWVIA
jgi:hypothetical protein